jgi:hypothetical protein
MHFMSHAHSLYISVYPSPSIPQPKYTPAQRTYARTNPLPPNQYAPVFVSFSAASRTSLLSCLISGRRFSSMRAPGLLRSASRGFSAAWEVCGAACRATCGVTDNAGMRAGIKLWPVLLDRVRFRRVLLCSIIHLCTKL